MQPQEQLQTGRFYYKDGATYEGQYKLIGLQPAAAVEPAKKGAKKKEDEAPAQPAEPPKPVRHGVGELKLCHMIMHVAAADMAFKWYLSGEKAPL